MIGFSRDPDPDERLGPGPHPPLVVRGLSAGYGRGVVISDVDLACEAGRTIAIVGPNGAGKSTLLKACLGLLPDVVGLVTFFGRPLARVRKRVAYVPQRESVEWDFPVTALDVVLMGRYPRIGWLGRITREHREAARSALRRVDLEAFADAQIGELSGGQQQRVFLARALASEADLYLLDEPESGLDAASRLEVEAVLRQLADSGRTVVCVVHDIEAVRRAFDEVVLVRGGVLAQGPTSQVLASDAFRAAYAGVAPEGGADAR
ncbi:MAG: metal ABC transporter ATP-binding protein [Planctomycetota bacterium]